MTRIVAAALCGLCAGVLHLPAAVHAQVLRKCVDAQAGVAYQSQPCPPGACEAWAREYVPDPPPPPSPAVVPGKPVTSTAAMPRGARRGGARTAMGARIGLSPRDGSTACEAARARRERVLTRVGLKRDFDLLRRLDETVRRSCD